MMRTRLPLLILVAIAALGTAGADAGKGKGKGKQVKYVGVHPIQKQHGGGVCHIEVPHVHVYAPADAEVQYRVVDDGYYFVGDPVAYGWDGPRYTYKGHHPVPVGELVYDHDHGDDAHVEYCYLDGAHFHHYQPSAALSFEVKGDAYWYVGDLPDAYVEARATLDPIDVVYEPIAYVRPVVVVEPPEAWVGLSLAVAAPVVVVDDHRHKKHGHGHVHGGVSAGLSVEISVPGIIVTTDDHHHHHGKHKKHKKHKRHKRGRGHWKGRW